MLFHTLTFAVFFLIVLALIGVARNNTQKKIVLLIASYVFYMWWNPAFVPLIAASTIVDYAVGLALEKTQRSSHRKWLVVASICTQLGLLAYFKYAGFLTSNLFVISRWLGFHPSPFLIDVTLPVGISFYTFATLSYSIDVYRRNIPATKSLLDFAVFIAFFPHLVAGPIVRASQLLPQLENENRMRCSQQTVFLFMRGLAKKVLVADNLSVFAATILTNPARWPSLAIWIGAAAFSVQIYCDFSGYSDMAIAVARVLGYELPNNFSHPYFASNPSDFWRRWHITLSSWLRDYLYIPLGGNRGGWSFVGRNLFLTMLLGGLWHGGSWNFVLWGAWHGVLLIVYRAYTHIRPHISGLAYFPRAIRRIGSIALTQLCVVIGWVMFSIRDAGKLLIALRKLLGFDGNATLGGIGLGSLGLLSCFLIMTAFAIAHFWSYRHGTAERYLGDVSVRYAAIIGVAAGLLFCLFWPSAQAAYIYFQF